MMLGAGLRVAEVIGLHRDEVAGELNPDGSLLIHIEPVDKHDTSYAHQTAVRPELVTDVLNWIRERDMLPVGGDLLFPGTHGELLNKATVYLQVKKTFLRAGLNLPRRVAVLCVILCVARAGSEYQHRCRPRKAGARRKPFCPQIQERHRKNLRQTGNAP
jgi:hypothetical protein